MGAVLFRIPLWGQDLKQKDRDAISLVMQDQEDAWNRGDIEGFMQGYWQSDSLLFMGKSGPTYGWQKTLDNYRKGYPDKAAMGRLTFGIISVRGVGNRSAFVAGSWQLQRTAGDLAGHFTLLWEKKNGQWVIVVDHSS